MQKTIYRDYKYAMQDTSRIYVGCKYTFSELAEDEEVPFKFRLVVQKYIVPNVDGEDTLETFLYYMSDRDFSVKLLKQMKARIKVNLIEEKKKLFGGTKKEYVTKQLSVEELVAMPRSRKEAVGLVIQEISVSKLALAAL